MDQQKKSIKLINNWLLIYGIIILIWALASLISLSFITNNLFTLANGEAESGYFWADALLIFPQKIYLAIAIPFAFYWLISSTSAVSKALDYKKTRIRALTAIITILLSYEFLAVGFKTASTEGMLPYGWASFVLDIYKWSIAVVALYKLMTIIFIVYHLVVIKRRQKSEEPIRKKG